VATISILQVLAVQLGLQILSSNFSWEIASSFLGSWLRKTKTWDMIFRRLSPVDIGCATILGHLVLIPSWWNPKKFEAFKVLMLHATDCSFRLNLGSSWCEVLIFPVYHISCYTFKACDRCTHTCGVVVLSLDHLWRDGCHG
jgi:hypothetical protein